MAFVYILCIIVKQKINIIILMKNNKYLNELRQTKDCYYEVPKNNNNYNLEQIVNDFNSKSSENTFNLNQVKEFLDFVKIRGYRLR